MSEISKMFNATVFDFTLFYKSCIESGKALFSDGIDLKFDSKKNNVVYQHGFLTTKIGAPKI